MIITRLTLQNYKQYRGEHVFDIAEDATIGVIGANGVGKTTIFEAIEWCLYKPRGIENQDIRPRGTGGEVKVVLQLTTNDGSKTFEVERVLKRSSTLATIYEINEIGGGNPIIQGTREVTDYISSALIGLGHAAFVATFFTRQKELGFFGTLRPAERRREVGKLLGLETIKQAQQLIADERGEVRADADSLQRQYDARVKDRDLEAEIASAQAEIDAHRGSIENATRAVQAAEQATETLDQRVHKLQDQRDRHTAIMAELRTLEARQQHATEQRDGIGAQLGNLDAREQERGSLAVRAREEPALLAERSRLEGERERFQTRQRLLAEVDGCRRAFDQAEAEVRQLVRQTTGATDHPDWHWNSADAVDPLAGIDRLCAVIGAVDLAGSERRLEHLRAALAAFDMHGQEDAKLQKYRERRQQLFSKVDLLLRTGDPATHRARLESALSTARAEKSDAQAVAESVEQQIATSRAVVQRLEHQHFEDACPTCGRPFDDEQAETVIGTMRAAIREHQGTIAAARQHIAEANASIEHLQQEMKQLQEREAEIQKCRASLASAKEYIQQQEETVAVTEQRLREALDRLDRQKPPAPHDVAGAERDVEHARALKGAEQPLRMLRNTIAATQEAEVRHRRDLERLADIAWDDTAYREVRHKHEAALRAASAVEQIDTELARRPQLEHDLSAAKTVIAELAGAISEQRRALAAVGFDAGKLDEATEQLKAARQQERDARETLAQAGRAAHQADHQLDLLLREKEQVAALLAEANEKRAQKAELDMMYSEFSEFDKFVAQKQSPLLSETTSDIVSEMTDGTYTRVEFDEDYGIQVYDDSEERFPLETFSGGERDAISLAARLALSRLIGSQATNPPGFLVLDEVFGSLDAERRERVLNLLGQHSSEYFRQMFIISHVDDVQQSPVFDTIWQVVETDDGSSEVNVGAGDPQAMLVD